MAEEFVGRPGRVVVFFVGGMNQLVEGGIGRLLVDVDLVDQLAIDIVAQKAGLIEHFDRQFFRRLEIRLAFDEDGGRLVDMT